MSIPTSASAALGAVPAACVADYGVTGSHLTTELEAIRREL